VIRLMDILLSLMGLVLLFPLMCLIYIAILIDTDVPFFSQERLGMHKKKFILYKFRTMKLETKLLPTHLVDISSITHIGKFLRRAKLDELPQLWNVLKGDMSMVGPRPNLFNQEELINARDALGVYDVRPGITGLAQIKNIDMSSPRLLAKTDSEMISTMSVANYFKYIFFTVAGKGQGDGVRR